MMVWYFADKLSTPYDLCKALKICLVHDLPEMITGDTVATSPDSVYNSTTGKQDKHTQETQAMQEIMWHIKASNQQEINNLRKEYKDLSSYEAQVVSLIDKIEAFLQVYEHTNGVMYTEHVEFSIRMLEWFYGVDPYFDVILDGIKSVVEREL